MKHIFYKHSIKMITDYPLETLTDDLSLNVLHSNIYRIVECDDGYIHPSGFVFDSKGTPFTFDKWYNKNYPSSLDTDTLKDKVCLSLIQVYNDTFQHIPFDSFPKILAIQKLLFKYPEMKIVVDNELLKKMMISFFGLHNGLFIVVKKKAIYKCKRALYVNHLHTSGVHTKMGSWGANILRPWILPRPVESSKLVYLSREGLPKRVLTKTQELELVDKLRDTATQTGLDFVIVNNPKTPEEVVDIIGKAKLIIGIHGGAFANMIHANSSTRIMEIIPKIRLEERPCFYYLASSLGLKYTFYEPVAFDFEGGVTINIHVLCSIIPSFLN